MKNTPVSLVAGNTQLKNTYIPALLRQRMVAEMTYLLAKRRGHAPGYELKDWFEAERVIAEHFPEE